MSSPLIFVNIGWMNFYNGSKDDPTIGGHGWLKNHDYGHEAWNYLPHEGRLYGYVPRSQRIDISRLGAGAKENRISGVTVIWIARSPQNGRTYIVGWYLDATIYREMNHFTIFRANGQPVDYQIEAPIDEARLLTPDQRTVRVPTAKVKGNLGQSPVWYGNPEFIALTRTYLNSWRTAAEPTSGESGGKARQSDPELRKKVELAAVRHAIDYYESVEGGGRFVESVERDNVGWDLVVSGGDDILKVEVKGLSGKEVVAELTPNEYKKMMASENRSAYVIYIVTEALAPGIKSHVFYYNAEASSGTNKIWNTHDGRVLKIEPLTGARITVS